jgi:hypothetical protein
MSTMWNGLVLEAQFEKSYDKVQFLKYKISIFLHLNIFRLHIKTKKYFCDLCEYGTPLKGDLRGHMVIHLDPEERRLG